MTDLRDQLARLLDNEPAAPYDIDRIVRSGRRARRRHSVALATAGTVGAAGVTAAVVLPLTAGGGNDASVGLGAAPSPSPTAKPATCYLISAPAKGVKAEIARLVRSGRLSEPLAIKRLRGVNKHGGQVVLEACSGGAAPAAPRKDTPDEAQPPAGPPYDYTEKPEAVASRLAAHLQDRVNGFGLSISYTRPFSQESSTLEGGRPFYYGGNVDIHETSGYADIGVQVTHAVTELVPFTDDCTAAQHCTETKLPDGSVLRTGQVTAGPGDVILTAEVHRPDGLVVQAQESNYPFGPDAGSQQHGDQPLTLDQLVSLAKDSAFTF